MEHSATLVGQYAPDFELPGIDGQVHHLSRYLTAYRAVTVIIMSNHCPYVRSYLDCLKGIQSDFSAENTTLVGINGNDDSRYPEDSFDNMKTFAKEYRLNFPYLRDATQDVIRCFGATCTPEVFLINQSGVICYRGAVDDGVRQLQGAQVHHLREAIAQLLNHQSVTISATKPIGGAIRWRS
jgi:peroxiredoxin